LKKSYSRIRMKRHKKTRLKRTCDDAPFEIGSTSSLQVGFVWVCIGFELALFSASEQLDLFS